MTEIGETYLIIIGDKVEEPHFCALWDGFYIEKKIIVQFEINGSIPILSCLEFNRALTA